LLERTHKLLTDITGIAPRGWRSPSGHKTARTLHKLRELGYVYDSSDKDFDLPYLLRYEGQEHDNYVCLPNNTSSLDDFPFYRVSYTPPSEVLTHWLQEFDAIYAEGGYFNLTVHPRVGYGSGSPARVAIVEKLIEYIKQHDSVHFVGMLELAQWCLKHPADWRRNWVVSRPAPSEEGEVSRDGRSCAVPPTTRAATVPVPAIRAYPSRSGVPEWKTPSRSGCRLTGPQPSSASRDPTSFR